MLIAAAAIGAAAALAAADPTALPLGDDKVTTADRSGAGSTALDANGLDAVAHELQDRCGGHSAPDGRYHYHSLSPCAAGAPTAHAKLVGYALDGFGIYGNRGPGGKPLANLDLDAYHGHTHTVTWRGKQTRMFHYHATPDYPYTVGCYRGTPVQTGPPG